MKWAFLVFLVILMVCAFFLTNLPEKTVPQDLTRAEAEEIVANLVYVSSPGTGLYFACYRDKITGAVIITNVPRW